MIIRNNYNIIKENERKEIFAETRLKICGKNFRLPIAFFVLLL